MQTKCFREINQIVAEHLCGKLNQSHNPAAPQWFDLSLTTEELEDSQIQIQMVKDSAVTKCVAQMGIWNGVTEGQFYTCVTLVTLKD